MSLSIFTFTIVNTPITILYHFILIFVLFFLIFLIFFIFFIFVIIVIFLIFLLLLFFLFLVFLFFWFAFTWFSIFLLFFFFSVIIWLNDFFDLIVLFFDQLRYLFVLLFEELDDKGITGLIGLNSLRLLLVLNLLFELKLRHCNHTFKILPITIHDSYLFFDSFYFIILLIRYLYWIDNSIPYCDNLLILLLCDLVNHTIDPLLHHQLSLI